MHTHFTAKINFTSFFLIFLNTLCKERERVTKKMKAFKTRIILNEYSRSLNNFTTNFIYVIMESYNFKIYLNASNGFVC